jgi:hypothetical protein
MPSFRCSFLRSPAGAYRHSQSVSSLLARRPGKLVSSSLSAKRLRRRLNWLARLAPGEDLAAWPRLADMASENTSRLSLWSRNSLLSIASESSILSIGSIGSVLSVGSVGSFASFGSLGSFAASLSTGSAMAHGSVMSFQSTGSVMSSQSTRAVNDHRNSGSLPGWGGAAITLGAVALSFALYLMTRRTQR